MSRNRKKGKAKQAIGLLFMLLSLTSCGRLRSNYAIETGIREILPDAVILNVETGTRSKGRKFKRFTVDNTDSDVQNRQSLKLPVRENLNTYTFYLTNPVFLQDTSPAFEIQYTD